MGPLTGPPPAPEKWVIIREKSAGTNPGFTARDANGETWFLGVRFAGATGGRVGRGHHRHRIFWALGYNQIETFITTFDLKRMEIDPKATTRRPSGARTRLTRDDVNEDPRARGPQRRRDLSCRRRPAAHGQESWVPSGTRARAPTTPTTSSRTSTAASCGRCACSARGRTSSDLKAGNTLDALVVDNGRSTVKHYLQDVGSSFGMANNPHEWDMGWEYFWRAPSRVAG